MRFALAFAALLSLTAVASAQTPGSGIAGSPHDFSSGSTWNGTKQNEICGVCHIPHSEGRAATQQGDLLWGRSLSTATYTMYTSPTLDGAQSAAPDGTSALCLGCHDGTVGLEHFDGTTTGSTLIQSINTWLQTPADMSNEHPISIVYDDALDTGLNPKTATFGTGTIQDVLEGTTNKVQCASCHDVHNKDVESTAVRLLRIDNSKAASPSALCLACHNK